MIMMKIFKKFSFKKPKQEDFSLSKIAGFCVIPFIIYSMIFQKKESTNAPATAPIKAQEVQKQEAPEAVNIAPEVAPSEPEKSEIEPFFKEESVIPALPPKTAQTSGAIASAINILQTYRRVSDLGKLLRLDKTVLKTTITHSDSLDYAICKSVVELDIKGYNEKGELFFEDDNFIIHQNAPGLPQGLKYLPLASKSGEEIEAIIPSRFMFEKYTKMPRNLANVQLIDFNDTITYKAKVKKVHSAMSPEYEPKFFFKTRTLDVNLMCETVTNIDFTLTNLKNQNLVQVNKSFKIADLPEILQIFLLQLSHGDEAEVILHKNDIPPIFKKNNLQDEFYALKIKIPVLENKIK
jgi:hypothetical protein